MKTPALTSILGSVALAGLHLSCAGSDDSNWQRPSMMPARSSWDARASYAPPPSYAPQVQRASAQQSSYQLPQGDGYRPAGADAFPALPPEPPPPAPRAGFTGGVTPGELPVVAEARRQGRPWKQAAEQVIAKLQEPELRAELQKRLDEIVPAVARALMDRPTEDAIVTLAVYRDAGSGAGDGAAPATQPGKQVAVAVAFEGFGGEQDDTFLPRVLADMPRPTAERQALAAATTQPTTQPGDAGAVPATQPAPPNLVLDSEASGYLVFFLGDEGMTASVISHPEMKRSVVAALTAGGAGPATGPAGAAASATQPATPEELAEMARRELELREREMEAWRNWYDADRERYERDLAERELYEQQREAEYEARRQYDRGYDDGLYAGSDYGYGYGYGHGYYYPRWHHYRWSHYRYSPGWYYSPSLIVIGGHRPHFRRHWHHGDWVRHVHKDKDHHDHHDGGRANRPNAPRRNFGLPSTNLPTASTGRVPWGAPPPAFPSGAMTGSGMLGRGGNAFQDANAGRTSPFRRPSAAIRTSPRGDGVFSGRGNQDGSRSGARDAGRDASRSASGRLNAAPPRDPPIQGPRPFDRGAAPAPTPSERSAPRGGDVLRPSRPPVQGPRPFDRAAPAPSPSERSAPRGGDVFTPSRPPPSASPGRSSSVGRSSSRGRSFTPSPSPSPSRAAPSPRGGGGGRSSDVGSSRSSPRGDGFRQSVSGGGASRGGGGGSSRGGGGSSRGGSSSESQRGPRG